MSQFRPVKVNYPFVQFPTYLVRRNHPIIKDDAVLTVFLTVPSLEEWRKNTSVSLDEESTNKHIDKLEEMTIPSDLEDKIAYVFTVSSYLVISRLDSTVRGKVIPLIDQWQRICLLSEKIIKRREAAAVRGPKFRRPFLATHTALSLSASAPASPTLSSNSSIQSPTPSITSFMDLFSPTHFDAPLGIQGDLARLTNTIRTVAEVNEHCWRGDECELSNGVRMGLEQVAAHCQRHTELSELRVERSLPFSGLPAD